MFNGRSSDYVVGLRTLPDVYIWRQWCVFAPIIQLTAAGLSENFTRVPFLTACSGPVACAKV